MLPLGNSCITIREQLYYYQGIVVLPSGNSCVTIREQLYYNNEHKEVVTSIHEGIIVLPSRNSCFAIREQLQYRNGHQEVVTSINFVKMKIKCLGFKPTPAGPSLVFSLML